MAALDKGAATFKGGIVTRRRRLGIASLVFLLILIALLRWIAVPQARPALGYVAKVVCSDVFVGGATAAQALGDLPQEPIARIVRTQIDNTLRTVRASIPLLASRRAL